VRATGQQNYNELIDDIDIIPSDENGIRCPFGHAVITSAPGLKFEAIIHTVGANSSIHRDQDEQEVKQ
jgi:O-acetyl-ADP-ribose deacetylase (regulator of RNase III)